MNYDIRVKGDLGPQWAGWFDGLTVIPAEDGDTLLTGPIVDQAALYGLLRKLRDIGLPLVSVTSSLTSSETLDVLDRRDNRRDRFR